MRLVLAMAELFSLAVSPTVSAVMNSAIEPRRTQTSALACMRHDLFAICAPPPPPGCPENMWRHRHSISAGLPAPAALAMRRFFLERFLITSADCRIQNGMSLTSVASGMATIFKSPQRCT